MFCGIRRCYTPDSGGGQQTGRGNERSFRIGGSYGPLEVLSPRVEGRAIPSWPSKDY